MATAAVAMHAGSSSRPVAGGAGGAALSTRSGGPAGGVHFYYESKLEELEHTIREKRANLQRLGAQRDALNSRGK
jgi:hypothetical protein